MNKRKSFIISICFITTVFMLISCSKRLDVTKLEKSKYTNIGENKEISVMIKEEEIATNTDRITLLLTNNSDFKYSYDKEPHLEIKKDSTWYVVPVLQILCWSDLSYLLPEKDILEESFSLKDYYGKLESGSYRLINEFYCNDSTVIIGTEFNVN